MLLDLCTPCGSFLAPPLCVFLSLLRLYHQINKLTFLFEDLFLNLKKWGLTLFVILGLLNCSSVCVYLSFACPNIFLPSDIVHIVFI
uniref:Uncharacterized protein n=1 Tax=Arundo donax TaxID=35708 RepID=A0A0A8ZGU1_ARUDO